MFTVEYVKGKSARLGMGTITMVSGRVYDGLEIFDEIEGYMVGIKSYARLISEGTTKETVHLFKSQNIEMIAILSQE